jgi:hypothetical protein
MKNYTDGRFKEDEITNKTDHLPDFGLSKVLQVTEYGHVFRNNFHHFIALQTIMKHRGGVRNYEGSYLMDGVTL